MPKYQRKAIIRNAKGKNIGQFRFILVGDNGEIVGTSGTETYTQIHNVKKTLRKYFSGFKIIDGTDLKTSDKKLATAHLA